MLAKVRDSGAQAIIMYGHADTTPIVARQMLEIGLAGKVALVGNGEFNTEVTIKAAPKALEGAVEAAAWLPGRDAPRSLAFVDEVQRAYVARCPTTTPTCIGKPCTWWLRRSKWPAAAIDETADALSKIKYDSASGEVTFDDHNQQCYRWCCSKSPTASRSSRVLTRPNQLRPGQVGITADERQYQNGSFIRRRSIVNGIISGSCTPVAAGMTMIFGVLRAIKFAHGEYSWGALSRLVRDLEVRVPYPVAIVIGVIATALIAVMTATS